ENQITDYDMAISVGDLPALLTNTMETVEANDIIRSAISLQANTEVVTELKNLLASYGPPPYIGLTWRGGQKEKNLLFKSVPIDQLLNAIKDIDATFISLQRNPAADEIDKIRQHPRFSTMPDFSKLNEDLPRMLALLSFIDDYVGVSNTNMHLRASVKKKAKVLVPHPPEWRWMLRGHESPWFPGFEILRQSPDNDWSAALSELTQGLQKQYA
ncbi:MAG: hypothetical protein OEX07_10970, partial [Gammaproteobacteria bacterium]|nr:hypothetical protein [Gammaproteobacteria bacterium]